MEENKYTFENKEYRDTYRHSTSHVLAQAVKRLYPESKLAIGPAIADGFYYDIDSDVTFTPEVLEKLEEEMRRICKEKLPIERFELPREEAIKFMADRDEPYKVELIEDLPEGEAISFYKQGEFTDLCAGPHLDNTGRIKGNAIKLMNCTGAYWRGDSSRKMLQRIYGTCFMKKEELQAYLDRLEEAKRRDHRKLGRELGALHDERGRPGLPLLPAQRHDAEEHAHRLLARGAQALRLCGDLHAHHPQPRALGAQRPLGPLQGQHVHHGHRRADYAIKPMNCPGGMLVYENEPHSYRDLPLRVGELGLVHRHELSGALHGLFRVRCFTQDDAHIFMTPEQMKGRDQGRRQAVRRGLLHLRPQV